MHLKIAKTRMNEVIRTDTVASSEADFLATHVPFKKVLILKGGALEKGGSSSNEEEIYNNYIINSDNKHQFIVVSGVSGAGKSHLIRWFAARLKQSELDNEVVLFIRRSDNTLKGTIKQLLNIDEVSQIPNKEVYDRLVKATSTVEDNKFRDMIYQNFIVEIRNDEETEILSNVTKKQLEALLQNESFQERLKKADGPIDRIYAKVAEENKSGNKDIVALFNEEDFYVDVDFCDELLRDEADRKARKMSDKLLAEPELANDTAKYLNGFVDSVIQTCAGLEPGDFEQIFKDIRRELRRQGKNLTLLIEDITAFTGINRALLNVLTTEHTGMYEEQQLCRISSIIGTTEEYYKEFRDNYKDRITTELKISDSALGENENDLFEFVGRYLNVMSLEKEQVNDWVNSGLLVSEYPVHEVVEGTNWDFVELDNGIKLNLYPFTKHAILNLYNIVLGEFKTPRYLLRDVIERTVNDVLVNKEKFPGFTMNPIPIWNPIDHREYIRERVNADDFERINKFMCVWGEANAYRTNENGINYLAGIPISIYEELKLPIVDGLSTNGGKASEPSKNGITKQVTVSKEMSINTQQSKEKQKEQETLQRYQKELERVEKWVAGATFDEFKRVRDDICNYLYTAINWQCEGVSFDNFTRTKTRKLIGFERQKRGEDKMFLMLPANRETQSIIEAFLAWRMLGKESWSFEGAPMMIYRVMVWTEKIKSDLVASINIFDNHDVDYCECAMMAEMYRLIMFGLYKGNTVDNMHQELLLANNIKKVTENAHSKAWNDVMNLMVRSEQDKTNKEVVIQYFNLVQGNQKSSQVFINEVEFAKALKKVKNKKLKFDDVTLQLYDPVRLRRDSREYLQKILERIDKVSEEETAKAQQLIETITRYFDDEEDIEDDDILDLIEKIISFYNEANAAQVNVKYDVNLIESIRKDAKSIGIAIDTVQKACTKENSLDCLMLFSQDPMKKIEKLQELLLKVEKDALYVKQDIQKRHEKLNNTMSSGSSNVRYQKVKSMVEHGRTIINEMEV